jgi:hypothetical protein
LVAGGLLGAVGASHTVLLYAAWLFALAVGATLNRGLREGAAAPAPPIRMAASAQAPSPPRR